MNFSTVIADAALSHSLGRDERQLAIGALCSYFPAAEELSYEHSVYLLGGLGQERAANALINLLGPTDLTLTIRPVRGAQPATLTGLYWPGSVVTHGDLRLERGGFVGGLLMLGGRLSCAQVVRCARLSSRGRVLGPPVLLKPPGASADARSTESSDFQMHLRLGNAAR